MRESRGCEVLGIHDRTGGRFSPHGGDSRRGMLGICEASFTQAGPRGRWHPIGRCANSMARYRLSTHPYIDRFDIPKSEKSFCVILSSREAGFVSHFNGFWTRLVNNIFGATTSPSTLHLICQKTEISIWENGRRIFVAFFIFSHPINPKARIKIIILFSSTIIKIISLENFCLDNINKLFIFKDMFMKSRLHLRSILHVHKSLAYIFDEQRSTSLQLSYAFCSYLQLSFVRSHRHGDCDTLTM